MKNTHGLVFFTSAVVLTSLALVSTTRAQSTGNDAVYNSTNGVTFSPSFIDASMLLPPNSQLGKDLCDAIYGLLSGQAGFPHYPSVGAVIDARGVSGTTNLTCTHGTPWSEGSNSGRPSLDDLVTGYLRSHSDSDHHFHSLGYSEQYSLNRRRRRPRVKRRYNNPGVGQFQYDSRLHYALRIICGRLRNLGRAAYD